MLVAHKPQWVPSFSNPAFGDVQVVHIHNEEGKSVYEQVLFSEPRGEIDIIVNDEGQIAFVVNERHAVLDPALYAKDWGKAPVDYFAFEPEQRGMTVLELPRGLNTKLMGEANEEAKYEVADTEIIGNMNVNTASVVTSPFVAVGRATRRIENAVEHDPNERVIGVKWLTPKEARNIDTIDAFTHAALHMVRSWALDQVDPFWHTLGESL